MLTTKLHLLPRAQQLRLASATVLLGLLAGCSDAVGRDDALAPGEDASALGEDASGGGGDGMGQMTPPEPPKAPESMAPEPDDDVTRTPWQNVGAGVSYKAFGPGANVLLVYGGYTAQDDYVQRWTNELYRAKGAALGIGHLYAVKGPNQAGYQNREIGNRKLTIHLGQAGRAANASSLVVIAHSSGTYVTDELFSMLDENTGVVPPTTIGKVDFFNLDGGGPGSVDRLRRFSSAYFVFGCDPVINRCSHNAAGMRSLGAQYASLGGAFEVKAPNTRCDARAAGGLWCLHDTLITNLPHNPLSYDLARDYTDFTGARRVTTSYLDVLSTVAGR